MKLRSIQNDKILLLEKALLFHHGELPNPSKDFPNYDSIKHILGPVYSIDVELFGQYYLDEDEAELNILLTACVRGEDTLRRIIRLDTNDMSYDQFIDAVTKSQAIVKYKYASTPKDDMEIAYDIVVPLCWNAGDGNPSELRITVATSREGLFINNDKISFNEDKFVVETREKLRNLSKADKN